MRDKLVNVAKQQSAGLLAAEVSDADVARYILTEIGNGKKPWMKALAKVAKVGLKLSPLGPLVASEVEA